MNIKYITFLYKNIRQKAKRYDVFFLQSSSINIYTCVDGDTQRKMQIFINY